MCFGPSHEDIAEVDGHEGLENEVTPNPVDRLLEALITRDSASEVQVSLALDVADVVVVLVEGFLSALVVENSAVEGEVGLVSAVEDKAADEVGEEEHVFGRLGWADPGHDPHQGNDGGAHQEWQEDIPVLWESVDLEAEADGAKDSEDTKCRHATIEWQAEAALFTHA